jgi:transposase
MIIEPSWIGIDIGKFHLDVFDSGRTFRLDNDEKGIAELMDRLAARKVSVVFEATGVYDRKLRRALQAETIRFERVNPRKARQFAEAAGFLAKADHLDPRMLAAMGQAISTVKTALVTPEDEDRQHLADLHRRRDQLVAMRKQERARLIDAPEYLRADLEAHIAWLDQAIRDIERRCREAVLASDEFRRRDEIIRSAPGIGPVAATTLIALMPELGQRSPKTIAALAGLAPFNAESGQFRGKRRIKNGRHRVRDALYMSAVTAARSYPRFRAFYRRLVDAGKPPKVAIIALARKLLVILNAMLRTQTLFQA